MEAKKLLAALLVAAAVTPTLSGAVDEAGRSATDFIVSAVRPSQGAAELDRAQRVLAALRHLGDPALEPMFARAAASPQAALQVHGHLGLAEISKGRQLALTPLAEVKEPAVQAQIITSGLDAGLLGDAEAQQLLAWKGLDPSVKILMALRRYGKPGFEEVVPLLREALAADQLGRRGLAGLMLHQMGDPAGTAALSELSAATDPQRDVARAMLLDTAVKHGFDRAAGWAYSVALEPGVDPALRMQALRCAMRFGERRATELWTQLFASTQDPSEQMRLGLVALRLSPWVTPELFDPLVASADPLLSQIGKTGRAVAAKDANLAAQIVALLLQHHPHTNSWALEYAKEWAAPEDAQLVFLGLIKAFDQGPAKTRARRVDETVEAAKLLHERFPAVATALLKPMLADGGTGIYVKQAVLLGLIQSEGDVTDIVADLPPLADREIANLAMLLKALSQAPLTEGETADLRVLARGGAMLRDELRAQASWAYLKRTGQAKQALAVMK